MAQVTGTIPTCTSSSWHSVPDLKLPSIHFFKEPLAIQLFQPTGVDEIFDLDRRGFGILFGDIFDDDSGSFERWIRLSVEFLQRLLIEIFSGINSGESEIPGDTFFYGLLVFFVKNKSIGFDDCTANGVDRRWVRRGEVPAHSEAVPWYGILAWFILRRG